MPKLESLKNVPIVKEVLSPLALESMGGAVMAFATNTLFVKFLSAYFPTGSMSELPADQKLIGGMDTGNWFVFAVLLIIAYLTSGSIRRMAIIGSIIHLYSQIAVWYFQGNPLFNITPTTP